MWIKSCALQECDCLNFAKGFFTRVLGYYYYFIEPLFLITIDQ